MGFMTVQEAKGSGGGRATMVFVRMDTGRKSDILEALLQNGVSMSRTPIETLLCPRISMSW